MYYLVNLFNFTIYISVPIVVRYLILRKPLKNKWLAIGILLPIFIAFSIVTYRIASASIMFHYLSALNDVAIERYGTGITTEEQKYYRNKFSADASKYGLWEATPAAIIQRQEIQRKIYQDYNITYEPGPRVLGSPMLLCLAMALSYFILLKDRRNASALNHNGSIQKVADSKTIEVSNFKPVCPNCKSEISIDFLYCHKCGKNLSKG